MGKAKSIEYKNRSYTYYKSRVGITNENSSEDQVQVTCVTVYNSFVLFWNNTEKSAVKSVSVSQYKIAKYDRDYEINDKKSDTLSV